MLHDVFVGQTSLFDCICPPAGWTNTKTIIIDFCLYCSKIRTNLYFIKVVNVLDYTIKAMDKIDGMTKEWV